MFNVLLVLNLEIGRLRNRHLWAVYTKARHFCRTNNTPLKPRRSHAGAAVGGPVIVVVVVLALAVLVDVIGTGCVICRANCVCQPPPFMPFTRISLDVVSSRRGRRKPSRLEAPDADSSLDARAEL